eukprot:4361964-Prymnesium_polylepis.1
MKADRSEDHVTSSLSIPLHPGARARARALGGGTPERNTRRGIHPSQDRSRAPSQSRKLHRASGAIQPQGA